MSWESIAGAAGYNLYRNNEIILSTEDLNSFIDDSLDYDSNYYFEICSYDKEKYEGPRVRIDITTHEKSLKLL